MKAEIALEEVNVLTWGRVDSRYLEHLWEAAQVPNTKGPRIKRNFYQDIQ